MKKIYLTESSLRRMSEAKAITFLSFYREIVRFVKGLLNNPIGARPSEVLLSNGLANGKLRHLLSSYGVVIKSEDIDEPINDENGKVESRYHLSYKVPKKNFKEKIRKMYNDEGIGEV